jgi:hypothetical protein
MNPNPVLPTVQVPRPAELVAQIRAAREEIANLKKLLRLSQAAEVAEAARVRRYARKGPDAN